MIKPTTDWMIQHRFGRRRPWHEHNLPWSPENGTRSTLATLLGVMQFNKGVEVGTNRGHYAVELCAANPSLHLTCIDPWLESSGDGGNRDQASLDRIYGRARYNLRKFNVTFVRKKSLDAVGDFIDQSLDFVYIDGNHLFDYCMLDLIRWMPKIKLGGIVALHDYHSQIMSDVKFAIDAYTRAHNIDPWYVTAEEWPTAFWVVK